MHLLELVYGTSADHCPDISQKRYNRLGLKNQLLKDLWNEDVETVELVAREDFDYALRQEEAPHIELPEHGFVYAPVCQGAEAGTAYVMLGETVIGRIPMVYGETVEQKYEKEPSLWERIFGG